MPVIDNPWRIVAVTGVCLAFSFYPLIGSTFGLFVTPIIAELGWSRAQISLAFSLTMGLVGVGAPFCGYIMDRWGARRVILCCTLMSAALLASGSLLGQRLTWFYLIYFLLGVVGVGNSPVAYSWIIVRWFDRNRGLALGLAATGLGVGSMILPLLVEPVIRNAGWRSGYFVLSGCILLVVVPLVYLLVADNPPAQQHGGQPAHPVATDTGCTFLQACKTRTFWLLLACFSALATLVYGCMLHLAPMLTDRGVTSEVAAVAMSIAGGGVIIGRIAAGFLLDRFEPRLVVVGFFFTTMLGGVLLLDTQVTVAEAMIAAVLIGMGLGAEGDFLAYLASRYFGLRAFGTIYGVIVSAVPIGGFLGPLLMGLSHDIWGTYQPMLTGLLLLCAVTVIFVTGFRRETEPSTEVAGDHVPGKLLVKN